ncbi:hypothetical protein [Candidatus Parabeggiatoa sp. HSG14]|uniref:hypothetical protein n=1 Tax=Candidatus Parabeggiatoa sp. HSG14 TaxID=3055593 RepID=UPI0025A76080|nr:hypothetical protein [Thiotrichales bacterium HSG14]
MSTLLKKRVSAFKWDINLGAVARTSCLFMAVSLATSPAAFAQNTPVTADTADIDSIGIATTSVVADEPEFVAENTPDIKLDELCKMALDRKEVINALKNGVTPKEIAEFYDTCSPPVKPVFKSDEPDADLIEVAEDVRKGVRQGIVSFTPAIPIGSTAYEYLKDCGYHPQRREFDCVVEKRRRHGYGGTPPQSQGSFEWVKVCVYYPLSSTSSGPPASTLSVGQQLLGNWNIVNTSAVHVHDEQYGAKPPWNYSVVVQADPKLHRQLMTGKTMYARAVLSWFYPVSTDNACNPKWWWSWGNVIKFRIKLDP